MRFDHEWLSAKTLGELKKTGYRYRSVRDELRENLEFAIHNRQNVFEGIYGYNETVIPELQRAILSRHHINLLGLRGQAKTRIARMMTGLLDPFVPVINGTEWPDDPIHPISPDGIEMVARMADDTPVSWMISHERYTEKLATPDVTVADLIGDVDPIKASNLKVAISDLRAIHYGIIPRSNRGIFVINELPDLQARIQVALFNILQEGDIQIRGFRLRLPLDIAFVFTANPEDYTNRGSIVTPLKDRIGSQILTHYPKEVEMSMKITLQEANISNDAKSKVNIPAHAHEICERVAFEARTNEFIDRKSGVSARLSITAYENFHSAVEWRVLMNKEQSGVARVADLDAIIPSITGKVELVYEGEQEGPMEVAKQLLGSAVRNVFLKYFPSPEKKKGQKEPKKADPYVTILGYFESGNTVDLGNAEPEHSFRSKLTSVEGLSDFVETHGNPRSEQEKYFMMEWVLHALANFSRISRRVSKNGSRSFGDLLSDVFGI
ncbi:MAG: hypothetical protein RLZZ46_90 [Bacteroidota bacterium]|jgi:magnesium chelatase subunit I